MHFYEAA